MAVTTTIKQSSSSHTIVDAIQSTIVQQFPTTSVTVQEDE